MIKERLANNIKDAMLNGDKRRVEVLRSMKAAILSEEVALLLRDKGLSDEQIQGVLAREVKKRLEAANIYAKAGRQDRADAELEEKSIFEEFLPKQLTEDELAAVVDSVIAEQGKDVHFGVIISAVKAKVGTSADGGRIAAAVKSKLG